VLAVRCPFGTSNFVVREFLFTGRFLSLTMGLRLLESKRRAPSSSYPTRDAGDAMAKLPGVVRGPVPLPVVSGPVAPD
jgi:hypothetical protein